MWKRRKAYRRSHSSTTIGTLRSYVGWLEGKSCPISRSWAKSETFTSTFALLGQTLIARTSNERSAALARKAKPIKG